MDLREQLAFLGYDLLWIEWNLLSTNLLWQQVETLLSGDDPSTEHYRYVAFQAILAVHPAFDPHLLDCYLHLAGIDPDCAMAQSALCELINWRGLTSEQLREIAQRPAFLVPPMSNLVARRLQEK